MKFYYLLNIFFDPCKLNKVYHLRHPRKHLKYSKNNLEISAKVFLRIFLIDKTFMAKFNTE